MQKAWLHIEIFWCFVVIFSSWKPGVLSQKTLRTKHALTISTELPWKSAFENLDSPAALLLQWSITAEVQRECLENEVLRGKFNRVHLLALVKSDGEHDQQSKTGVILVAEFSSQVPDLNVRQVFLNIARTRQFGAYRVGNIKVNTIEGLIMMRNLLKINLAEHSYTDLDLDPQNVVFPPGAVIRGDKKWAIPLKLNATATTMVAVSANSTTVVSLDATSDTAINVLTQENATSLLLVPQNASDEISNANASRNSSSSIDQPLLSDFVNESWPFVTQSTAGTTATVPISGVLTFGTPLSPADAAVVSILLNETNNSTAANQLVNLTERLSPTSKCVTIVLPPDNANCRNVPKRQKKTRKHRKTTAQRSTGNNDVIATASPSGNVALQLNTNSEIVT